MNVHPPICEEILESQTHTHKYQLYCTRRMPHIVVHNRTMDRIGICNAYPDADSRRDWNGMIFISRLPVSLHGGHWLGIRTTMHHDLGDVLSISARNTLCRSVSLSVAIHFVQQIASKLLNPCKLNFIIFSAQTFLCTNAKHSFPHAESVRSTYFAMENDIKTINFIESHTIAGFIILVCRYRFMSSTVEKFRFHFPTESPNK